PFPDFQPAAESTPFADFQPAAESTPFADFQPAAEPTPFPDFQPSSEPATFPTGDTAPTEATTESAPEDAAMEGMDELLDPDASLSEAATEELPSSVAFPSDMPTSDSESDVQLGPFDPPTLEVDPTTSHDYTLPQAALPPAPESDGAWALEPPSEEVVVFADTFNAEEVAETEVVVPHTPPMSVAKLPTYLPGGDEREWRDAATALVAEAALDSTNRGKLLFEAGVIYLTRLNDQHGAQTLLSDALNAGFNSGELRRHLAELASGRDQWNDVVEHLAERAALIGGSGASETLQEVANIAGRKLWNPNGAVEYLQQALEYDNDDYAALSLLRDYLSEVGLSEEHQQTLGKIGDLAAGTLAAEAYWEQGTVLQQLDRREQAKECFAKALQAVPGHTASLLGLEAAVLADGDLNALGDLYLSQADGDEFGWWLLKAARAYRVANEKDKADDAFAKAASIGLDLATREYLAWLCETGRDEQQATELAAYVERQTDPIAKAFSLFRLGWLREKSLGDTEAALEVYKEAFISDPKASPAAEAVARILKQSEKTDELMDFWEQRRSDTEDPNALVAVLLSMAELAEKRSDSEAAAECYEGIVEIDPTYPLALDGLERCYWRLKKWAELSALLTSRADRAHTTEEKAQLLYQAGGVGAPNKKNRARAIAAHRAALEAKPDHLPSVNALCSLLETEGTWPEIAHVLRRAAKELVGENSVKARLYYQAGRVLQDQAGDNEQAAAVLGECLVLAPGFVPALGRMRELCIHTGDNGELHRLYRQQAENSLDLEVRGWNRVIAAVVAEELEDVDSREDLLAVLEQMPEHPGALRAYEMDRLVNNDRPSLVPMYRGATIGVPDSGKAMMCALLADLQLEIGDAEGAAQTLEDFQNMDVPDRPLRPAAFTAQAAWSFETAGALLANSQRLEDRLEYARILNQKLRKPEAALAIYKEILAEQECLGAALGASRVARTVEDRETMVSAYRTLAENGESSAVKAAYAVWTGALLTEDGHDEEAVALYNLALDTRPTSEVAFEGACRALVARADIDGLRELFAQHRPEDLRGLATAIESSGGSADDIWRKLADTDPFAPFLVYLERSYAAAEDWSGAYHTLVEWQSICGDDSIKSGIEAKKRWLLAEKLSETEEAWELYQKLHEDNPEDREITESLARVAGARGDTQMAVQYLKELAESAETPEEAARYRRRVGEAYEKVEDLPNARQAFLDALDHVRDDSEALDCLKRLAEAEEDWPALIQVLQREVGLWIGSRQIAVLREIARVTETRIGDPLVAMDAWRSVLEKKSHDIETLQHLLALAESQEEWGTFVEVGNTLATISTGMERSTLLRRIGLACEEHLDSDDAIRFFELALAEDPPDISAAQRLEAIYRSRGEWGKTVRTLVLRSDLVEDADERVQLLVAAARIESETRHDREAAALLFAQILEINDTHEDALRFQAFHLFEAGRFDEALPVCQRLEPVVEEGQDMDDFDVRMELSQFYFYFAEMLNLAEGGVEAVSRYERALDLNPTHLASLEAIGPLYVETEQWKKAERVYRQLLQLSGGQGEREKVASTYTELGLVERKLGNVEKAYKRFNKALEIYPNHTKALKGMAFILGDRADWRGLLEIYNHIIYHATNPDDVIDAYMCKGRILDTAMDRPDKAAQHYERSLAFDGNQPVALLRLAELAMRRTDYMKAGTLARQALQLELEPGPLRSELLLCHAASRQFAADVHTARAEVAEAIRDCPELKEVVAADPLVDLEGLRAGIQSRLDQYQ
ncbi:MAG: tetratricopeptide repeat protein, partial [Proteobacteria bacterium]|nr:tetratricopeptide repeat protein [Pseudomonadota bacterium]